MLRILSLGAGVQSTTLLLMACAKELPSLDVAIFADTGWEPPRVYRHLDWLTQEAAKHGISVQRVQHGNLRDDTICRATTDTVRCASMGCFTLNPDGQRGKLPRQCTQDYKLRPIRRAVRRFAGYSPTDKIPAGLIEQWIGISIDESHRMSDSSVKFIINRFPLIDKDMTRDDCHEWLRHHGYEEPPRSSCVGCPFHSDAEWKNLRQNDPSAWSDAVEFDAAIRHQPGIVAQVFLHRSCQPLSEVVLRPGHDHGELSEDVCMACMT